MTLIYWERKKRIPQARHKLTRSAKRARRGCLSGEQPGLRHVGRLTQRKRARMCTPPFPALRNAPGLVLKLRQKPSLFARKPHGPFPGGPSSAASLFKPSPAARRSDPARKAASRKASLAHPPVQILAFNLRGIQRPRRHGNSGHFLSSDLRWSDRGTAAAN